jgi:hypothetical protein
MCPRIPLLSIQRIFPLLRYRVRCHRPNSFRIEVILTPRRSSSRRGRSSAHRSGRRHGAGRLDLARSGRARIGGASSPHRGQPDVMARRGPGTSGVKKPVLLDVEQGSMVRIELQCGLIGKANGWNSRIKGRPHGRCQIMNFWIGMSISGGVVCGRGAR